MPEIKIYNTLSGKIERFQSLSPKKVKMFVCGPTVQDYSHLGHAKTYVFYDVLARFLREMGYRVTFVMNITDVDDKIFEAAKKSNTDALLYAEKYTRAFLEDISKLGVKTVTKFEPASHYINEIIYQVSRLIEKGNAYTVDGYVYFDTSTFPHYGELSHQSLKELLLKPLDLFPNKKSPLDFALWRPSAPGEPHWPSPWGDGKPGWHIEDTAISITNFGPQYDIHGGGYELIYPHHEAEIAQAECFTGVRPFVKYWVHTGLLKLGEDKMSKSRGNVIYLKDAIREFGADTIRLYMLSEHYRKDSVYKEREIINLKEEYEQLKEKLSKLPFPRSTTKRHSSLFKEFIQAMCNDFDTPSALRHLRSLIKNALEEKNKTLETLLKDIRTVSRMLGVTFFE
jgi:cysteinyl-tRNA synthetase